jgi:predicted aspartyl protease
VKDFAQVLIIHHYLLIPTRISEDRDSDPTPGVFLIDTGASFSQVSNRIAGEITKVHESEYVRVKGLSGKVSKVFEANKLVLQFANFRQSNLGLISFDLSDISRGAGTEVMGILGIPLLGMFQSITLDYRDGLVKFDYKAL